MATLTPEALRAAGLDALQRELGVTGMVRFLRQFANGSGDYTADRWKWLPTDISVEDLVAMIRRESANSESPKD